MKKNSLLYILAALALVGGIYSFLNFDRAFPIVNVKISADKNAIIQTADSLNLACAFMDSSYRSVVGFDTDTRFKNYVELEGGGVEVFQEIVNSGIYHPYYWAVRQYNFNQIRECYTYCSP